MVMLTVAYFHIAQIANDGQFLCQCRPTDECYASFLETIEV
jgi:hypothetical protein